MTARKPIGILFAAVLVASGGCARTIRAEVTGIADGDSFTVLLDRRETRVRLQGIDAPERGQAFANRARQHLSDLIFGKEIEILIEGEDDYRRILGRVFVDGVDVNLQMVRDGYAWHFERYSDEEALAVAEQDARRARRGLWRDPNPVPPWQWRASRRDR